MTHKEKVLEICKNIKHTIARLENRKEMNTSPSKFTNPMFDKPMAEPTKLKIKLKNIMRQHNIKAEEL